MTDAAADRMALGLDAAGAGRVVSLVIDRDRTVVAVQTADGPGPQAVGRPLGDVLGADAADAIVALWSRGGAGGEDHDTAVSGAVSVQSLPGGLALVSLATAGHPAKDEGLLQAILDRVPAAVFLRDVDERWLIVNEYLAEVLGRPSAELIGKPLELTHSPEQAERFRADDMRVLAEGTTESYEVAFFDRSRGEEREWWLQRFPVHDANGRLAGVGGISVDITDRRVAERKLQAAEELFSAAFDHAPVGKLISRVLGDGSTEVLKLNAAFATMLGVDPEQVVGAAGALLCHPDDIPVRRRLIDAAMAGRRESAELRLVRGDGGHVWSLIAPVLVHADGGERLLVVQAVDISERRALEQQLRDLADHDELTGLLSRRRFMAELEREIARSARTGQDAYLLVVDLDGFKEINDRRGHPAGDDVLRRVAQRMRESLRATDLIGRLGGDEFAVVLPDTDAPGARLAAAKLIRTLATGDGLHVGASVGIAALGHGSAAQVIGHADAAMYRAKRAGGGRAVDS